MSSPSIMMVPSGTMFGMPYTPVNVYTAPPTVASTVAPSTLPNAEIELKQVIMIFFQLILIYYSNLLYSCIFILFIM